MTGSAGADSAAAYLARRFEQVGLQPAAGGWFQSFTVAKEAPVAQSARVGGLVGKNVIGLLPGHDPGAPQRDRHRRRPLRSPGARRVRQPRPGQHGTGPQRRRRQRLGRGDADPDRRPAGALAAGAHRALHRLQRRGAGPARLGPLREAAAVSAQRHDGDDQPRHGRAAPERPAHRLRRAHRQGVSGAARFAQLARGVRSQGPGRRLRPQRPVVVLCRRPAGAPRLHRPARRLSPDHRRLAEDRPRGIPPGRPTSPWGW